MAGTSIQTGLTSAEAARRLAVTGPNVLPRANQRGVATIALETMREPMFFLLLAAAAIYLLLGDLGEGLFLLAGAALTVGLVIVQAARSERALQALRDLAEPFALVVRDGARQRIPTRDLVPGDILLVAEGERLPADALLRAGDPLDLDESVLTGESAPVLKSPEPAARDDVAANLFAGTVVTRGHGLAEVRATAGHTAFGRIGASLAAIEEAPTPLQKAARRLTGVLGMLALAVCLLTVLAYGLLREDWLGGALSGLTLSIALIPEEFPMVLAVFMALGAWRLARRRVLVRRPAAIEALGAASVLCVDKTGTLTENRMRLARLWTDEGEREVDGAILHGAALGLVETAALASAASSSDPMDRAILDRRARAGADLVLGKAWPLCADRLAVVQLWTGPIGAVAAAKGAPEAVFKLCRLEADRIAGLRLELDRLAAEGLRVLAVASWRGNSAPDTPEALAFTFAGFLGFADPVRPGVPAALAEAGAAGITVVMITGDYPATALTIARRASIDTDAVVTGAAFAAMTPSQRLASIGRTRVFARVQPEQKLLLVEAFRARGDLVAMTGDGVNDAPALEAADIGIAMGRRGTDVAREAADIVLLDDDFSSLVGGVRLGRRIFANLRKALIFITAIHVPIAGLALIPILLGLPPMLLPMHLVLLELVIDPVCSLVFEAEPSDRAAMRRPPRRPREPLFGLAQAALALLQGAVLLVAVLAVYGGLLPLLPEPQARASAFTALVAGNLALALADSAAGVGLLHRSHLTFWAIAAGASLILVLVILTPGVNLMFGLAPPPAPWLLVGAFTGLVAGGWYGLGRPVGRLMTQLRSSP
jgi:Ca2+-transporting ATPase